MDLLSLLTYIYFSYIFLVCILLLFIDSDLLTFLYSKHGCNIIEKPFNDKVVWVTGASSGIGEALVKEFAKCENVKIVLSARRKEELERVKKECLGNNSLIKSNSMLILPFDMTDYTAHKQAFDKVLKTFGKLDILISNAGVSQRALWHEIDIDVDKQLFNLNVFSLINLNRLVVKYFLKRGKGQLAVTSSIAGKIGTPSASTYSGTKFALHGYFESLRNEVGHKGIDITILCPGPVTSNIRSASLTGKIGEVVGGDKNQKSRFGNTMSAERCAYLSLVGIGNKLGECWISPGMVVPFAYLAAYQPYIFSKLLAVFGKYLFKDPK